MLLTIQYYVGPRAWASVQNLSDSSEKGNNDDDDDAFFAPEDAAIPPTTDNKDQDSMEPRQSTTPPSGINPPNDTPVAAPVSYEQHFYNSN